MSPCGTKRTLRDVTHLSAFGGKANVAGETRAFRSDASDPSQKNRLAINGTQARQTVHEPESLFPSFLLDTAERGIYSPVVRAQLALRLRPALATPILANCASKVWR